MKIQTQNKKQERLIAKHQREDPSVVAAAASGSEAVPSHEGVNMLKQDFPMFSVKAILDSFHNQYMSAVESNVSIPDIQKLNYLKATVTGEAAQVVMHLSLSGSNYQFGLKVRKNRDQTYA